MKSKGIFLKILVIFVFLFIGSNSVFALSNIDPKIEKAFIKFTSKLEKKYNIEKEIQFLERINSKINSILENRKLSSKNKKILSDIVILSNEEIFKLKNNELSDNSSQKYLELAILNKLKKDLDKINVKSYIKKMGKKIYKISDKQEIVDNNSIKRIKFSKYYTITENNSKYLKEKKGIILVNKNGDSWFVENYNFGIKHPYSQSANLFDDYISYNKKYSSENNKFISYNFSKYTFFTDKYGFYDDDLIGNKINKNNTLLYLSDNKKYNFVVDYKKVKLIDSDIIFGITDKDIFLKHLINDKLYLYSDTDYLFIKLKNEIKKLTKGLKKEEKIKKIYDFVLDNVEYTKDLDLNDKKIFSGILTYKNKNGVCEGYAKLFSYALKFAGIAHADVIRGDVLDAKDFPKIGHAWAKIGKLYYDPTFDDPIGQKETRKFKDYNYFGLPKDLFYANRFDYGDTPEYLKTKSLPYRINFINARLSKLSDKYKDKKYLVLRGIDFKKEHNIKVGKQITIEDAKNIFTYNEVIEKKSGELVIYEKGIRKNITKLQFYKVNDENIEQILKQINYKTSGYFLFKWNKSGKIDYRLAFNVTIK